MILLFSILILLGSNLIAAEIIQDKKGDYYLIKSNGQVEKLPKPKPGNKYVIKKKIIKEPNININKNKKKARKRTNQGIR